LLLPCAFCVWHLSPVCCQAQQELAFYTRPMSASHGHAPHVAPLSNAQSTMPLHWRPSGSSMSSRLVQGAHGAAAVLRAVAAIAPTLLTASLSDLQRLLDASDAEVQQACTRASLTCSCPAACC
jgi:hypothetical protein